MFQVNERTVRRCKLEWNICYVRMQPRYGKLRSLFSDRHRDMIGVGKIFAQVRCVGVQDERCDK